MQNNRQLGKIVKKKKKKILVEHWQMQSEEAELSTEISKCDGCISESEQTEDSCQQWIRTNNNVNVIPNTLIKKSDGKIKTEINQLTGKVETEKLKCREHKLRRLEIIEELEIEIVKRQKLEENVNQEIIDALKRNMTRNKNKYIIYTDGAVNTKMQEKTLYKNMGIGWVQTNETQEWPEEELALSFEGCYHQ